MSIAPITKTRIPSQNINENQKYEAQIPSPLISSSFRKSLFQKLLAKGILSPQFELKEACKDNLYPPLMPEMENALKNELKEGGAYDFYELLQEKSIIDKTFIYGNWIVHFLFQRFPSYLNSVLKTLGISDEDLSKWPLTFPQHSILTLKSTVKVTDLQKLEEIYQEVAKKSSSALTRNIINNGSICLSILVNPQLRWTLEIQSDRTSICTLDDVALEISQIFKKKNSKLIPQSQSNRGAISFIHFIFGIFSAERLDQIAQSGWDWLLRYSISGVRCIDSKQENT